MIDAHHHFWKYNAKDYGWIDENMSAIRKSFSPGDFRSVLNENKIDGSILIQVNRDENENQLFLQFAKEYDFIKGTVGWVDLMAPNLEERLVRYSGEPKLIGFREIVQGNSDVYFNDLKFRKGVELIGRKGYTYDILVYEKDLPNTIDFVNTLPDNKFVIDHIAKPDIKNGSVSHWQTYMKQLSEFPNVYVKISGMTTEANWLNWKKEDFYPYLDFVFEHFGINRLMYGSDWPVCLLASSYSNQLDILNSYLTGFSREEKNKIFRKNAIEFYNLDL